MWEQCSQTPSDRSNQLHPSTQHRKVAGIAECHDAPARPFVPACVGVVGGQAGPLPGGAGGAPPALSVAEATNSAVAGRTQQISNKFPFPPHHPTGTHSQEPTPPIRLADFPRPRLTRHRVVTTSPHPHHTPLKPPPNRGSPTLEPRLPTGAPPLTDRQLEVARLVAQGLTNPEIGQHLGISLDGAKYHVSELLSRLNLQRRDDITTWYLQTQHPPRRLPALVGLAAATLATIAAAGIALVIVTSPQSTPAPSTASPPPGPSPTATEAPLGLEPLPTPAPATLDRELTLDLYRPLRWDHADRVNRIPPPSLAHIPEDRAIHRSNYVFEGTLPSVFDATTFDPTSNSTSDSAGACTALTPGTERAQSGDWVLNLPGYADQPTGTLSPGRYQLQLHPSDPNLLASLNVPELPNHPPGTIITTTGSFGPSSPYPIRIRAIDVNDWRSTHLIEHWSLPGRDDPTPDSYRLIFESPRTTRWLAVITAGPLWGCFLLDAERDPNNWPTRHYQISPDSVPHPSPSDIDAFTNLGTQIADTSFPATLETARVCVDANQAPLFTRSGEILALRLSSIASGIPLGPRGSRVQWVPAYADPASEFQLRAIHLTDDDDQPNHTYHVTSRARVGGRAIYSDPQGRSLEINAGSFATRTALPRPGGWTLVATAQPTNWGCFYLTARHMHDTYSANSSNPR